MTIERRPIRQKAFARDSFNNFAASLGYGASNLASGSTYGFNPISRNHILLEWAYRGSWLVRNVVDAVAEDMIREGIAIESDMPPDDMDRLMGYLDDLLVWQRLTSTIKWARLYGGCIAVIMVEGQKPETPLNVDSIGINQFKGLMVLDRWMLWPHLETPVTDLGQDFGLPKFYEVVGDAKGVPHMKIHYSRCIRIDGVELPYWQRIAENNWGLSVLEPLYDRLLAFDSTSQGAAQLVYKAHLRTLKIEKLRELIAFGGEGYQAVQQQIQMIRLMQSNEGLTVLDSTDEFDTHQYAFGGLSDVIVQFAQQLSGAAQIPLVRLFGQSPAGLNATGDADIRNYYDAINSQQEARLRRPINLLLDISHRSLFGKALPEGFDFSFVPLWQMTEAEKAEIAVNVVNAVGKATEDAIITPVIALKELRQSSKITGIFSNVTDEDIKEAEMAPPPVMGMPGDIPGANPPGAAAGEPATPGLPGHAPEHPPAAKAVTGAPSAAKEVESDDQEDYRSRLPPFNRAHVAAMYRHMRDSLPEGLHALIGPDDESEAVWLIQCNHPDGAYNGFQVMLGFGDREAALNAYNAQHDKQAIGSVKRMSLNNFKQFVGDFGEQAPKFTNGGPTE